MSTSNVFIFTFLHKIKYWEWSILDSKWKTVKLRSYRIDWVVNIQSWSPGCASPFVY